MRMLSNSLRTPAFRSRHQAAATWGLPSVHPIWSRTMHKCRFRFLLERFRSTIFRAKIRRRTTDFYTSFSSSEIFRSTELMCLPSLPRLRSQTRHIPALCLFILKICTEIKSSRRKLMFLVPNLYAKNLSAPDDAKSPYETWFV